MKNSVILDGSDANSPKLANFNDSSRKFSCLPRIFLKKRWHGPESSCKSCKTAYNKGSVLLAKPIERNRNVQFLQTSVKLFEFLKGILIGRGT